MSDYMEIEDELPEEGQKITAEILYMQEVSTILGTAFADRKSIVFDFYSGTGVEKIIRWKPTPQEELNNNRRWKLKSKISLLETRIESIDAEIKRQEEYKIKCKKELLSVGNEISELGDI